MVDWLTPLKRASSDCVMSSDFRNRLISASGGNFMMVNMIIHI
jgi:hypothetical protein